MDCCESRNALGTTRRSLLLGGASFAAWAYLPKFARAANGRDPRLIVPGEDSARPFRALKTPGQDA